jgi:hypothetical protein
MTIGWGRFRVGAVGPAHMPAVHSPTGRTSAGHTSVIQTQAGQTQAGQTQAGQTPGAPSISYLLTGAKSVGTIRLFFCAVM